MNGDVGRQKQKFRYLLLLRASIVLSGISTLLLACGALVFFVCIIRRIDGFYWVIGSLSGAVLLSNLGLICVYLAQRNLYQAYSASNAQLTVRQEPGVRRSIYVAATDRSEQNTIASLVWLSAIGKHLRSKLSMVR